MIDEKILITLIGIQNEALKQIAIEQRGGKAIKEEEIAPCPDWQEFKDERIGMMLDVPKGDTLEEMVRAEENAPTVDAQITIEEAVADAEKQDQALPTSKPTVQPASDDEPTSKVTSKATSKPRLIDLIKSYLQARRDWHYDRMSIEYGYECRKQQASDRIYGFEYMVKYIDKLIAEMKKDDSPSDGQVL